MSYLTDQFGNGLSAGSVYALVALGFSMVYGVLRLINFAHSEVFTTGVFASYFVSTLMARAFPSRAFLVVSCSIAVASLTAGVLAVLIQWVTYEPIRNEPRTRPLISAIGTSFLLQNIGIHVFTAHTRGFPVLMASRTAKQVTIGALVLSYALTLWLLRRTIWGMRARGIAEDRSVAELMGIWPAPVCTGIFFFGGAVAGLGGMMWGLMYGTVQPQMGFYPGLKAFIIAVLGSVGNVTGTVVMGLALGVIEALLAGYLPSGVSGYRDPIVFVLLLAGLVARPSGLFSQAVQDRA